MGKNQIIFCLNSLESSFCQSESPSTLISNDFQINDIPCDQTFVWFIYEKVIRLQFWGSTKGGLTAVRSEQKLCLSIFMKWCLSFTFTHSPEWKTHSLSHRNRYVFSISHFYVKIDFNRISPDIISEAMPSKPSFVFPFFICLQTCVVFTKSLYSLSYVYPIIRRDINTYDMIIAINAFVLLYNSCKRWPSLECLPHCLCTVLESSWHMLLTLISQHLDKRLEVDMNWHIIKNTGKQTNEKMFAFFIFQSVFNFFNQTNHLKDRQLKWNLSKNQSLFD